MLAPSTGRVFDSAIMPRVKKTALASQDRLSIRIDLATGLRIGPGKIAVLEEIARSGSISAAGRTLGMSYRRTWELVEDLNRGLGNPVVTTAAGGSGGGGASLTLVGAALVERYRAIEKDAEAAAQTHIAALNEARAGGRALPRALSALTKTKPDPRPHPPARPVAPSPRPAKPSAAAVPPHPAVF